MSILLVSIVLGMVALGLFIYALVIIPAKEGKEEEEERLKAAQTAAQLEQLKGELNLTHINFKKIQGQLQEEVKRFQQAAGDQGAVMKDYQALRAKLEAAVKDLAQREERIAALEKERDGFRGEGAALAARLAAKDEEAARAIESLKEQQARELVVTPSSEQENEQLRAECARLAEQLHAKEEEVVKLTEAGSRLQQEAAILRQERSQEGSPAQESVEVAQLKGALESSQREAEKLRNDLRKKDELMMSLNVGQGISQEEYLRVKEKLEAAEKVLRLLHGAG